MSRKSATDSTVQVKIDMQENLDYSIHTSASAGLSFPMNLEATITEVWRQALLENAKFVILASERFPVRLTPKSKLRQVDFFSMESDYADSNKTPIPNPVGRNSLARVKK